MKNLALILGVVFLAVMIAGNPNAYALSLGTNITIWDKQGVSYEDNEVEPGCVPGQVWDLEGFFINTSTNKFYMVGGFDFKNGVDGWTSGDIFFGPQGTPYGVDMGGSGNTVVSNIWGYTYALHLNFGTSNTWDLYQLTTETLLNVYFSGNTEANPWSLYQLPSTSYKSGSFTYYENKDDAFLENAVSKWPTYAYEKHNVVEINTVGSGLPLWNTYLIHFTYKCGNDNLMGQVTSSTQIPEPSTLILLGAGLIGLGIWRRRRSR